ncbi:glycoside hydrolase family 18 protein [Rossellomorea aquimaris]|uniref:glycoside hydrolase family 18 protein n=1 Tax=Rossellomorea aquimaris TaxID=189382 RepID=UPI0007D08525|nr:glycoside hydrolase family 18 protein [Rossellomorea aquimaris]
MKKKVQILFMISIIFVGGFTAGTLFAKNSANYESAKMVKTAEQSTKKPFQKNFPELSEAPSKVLIGYVQDYRDPDAIDYSKLTHVIFSFVHPEKDGSLSFNGEAASSNLRRMVSNAQKHDAKAFLAVGGWFHINGGESYEYFKSAIESLSSREKLVKELVSVAERENLDGIDVDFEHPRSKKDAQYLAAFINDLSNKLHAANKELSVAVHSKIHSVTGTVTDFVVYDPSMFKQVDFVNIMAYDGQWDGGYNAANLSPFPFTKKIVNYWSYLFDAHSISRDKLVLGVPLYGQPENPAIKQVSYEAIINNRNPEYAVKDKISMNGTTYYYNGEETMEKKTKLALTNRFGGMMIWEVGLDAKGPYSLSGAIAQALDNAKTKPEKYYSVKSSD